MEIFFHHHHNHDHDHSDDKTNCPKDYENMSSSGSSSPSLNKVEPFNSDEKSTIVSMKTDKTKNKNFKTYLKCKFNKKKQKVLV